MILRSDFPPDIRVEKEARSLIKAGYEVYLLCSYSENHPFEEMRDKIFIRRALTPDKRFFLRKINSLIFVTKFYHRRWAKEIEKLILDKKIGVLHIHDLPLVKTTLIVGEKYNIPVVADLHENYPAAVGVYKIPFWKRLYFDNQRRWKKNEKKCSERVNKIIVVVNEAKERIVKDYNISPNKITVVSNTVDIDYFSSIPLDKKLIEKYKNNFVISYIGGFGLHRGLDTAIKAMSLVAKETPDVKLLLVGGKNNEAELRNLAKKINLEKKIIFTGWQPEEKLPTYISLSNICLVPHHKNPHTDSTIPHKLFQYMLMKKPVIVSNCRPLERVIKETNAGLVFQAGNSQDLAEKIIQIYKNPDRYGENGYQAVLSKYNWGREARKLIELYNKIEEQNERRN